MQEIRFIHSDKAPAALGPYSQALAYGGLLILSGQTGLDPATGELAPDFAGQVRRVLDNLGAVLAAAGAGYGDVLAADVGVTRQGRGAPVNPPDGG
jgi:2-iminobutanoate/2-iminopropanoate deaminase